VVDLAKVGVEVAAAEGELCVGFGVEAGLIAVAEFVITGGSMGGPPVRHTVEGGGVCLVDFRRS